MKNKTMLTDLYQLTMNAAYHDNSKDEIATFDLFIRKLPADWGYFIANGIEDAIDYATNIEFEHEDIEYLRSIGIFNEEYLDWLKTFKFDGEILAVKDGTPIFPNEPIMRVTAKRSQGQLLESCLLNIVNFQTMVASKASRVVNSAKGASVVDFGLRRAQDESASLTGARACYIGGAVGTSNVKAAMEYGIRPVGTHAHSFVMSFSSELDAFKAYVKTFPDNATLLIDTYDTIRGAKNAAVVAKELEEKGKRLGSVRLDSGDLCDLSKKVRKILDDNNLDYVKILASNDLNEYKIADLVLHGAKIDGYGVGTEMITAKPTAAIPGVYKLCEDTDGAKIKLSDGKTTLPGKKQVYRLSDEDGYYIKDTIALEAELMYGQALLESVVAEGKRVRPRPSVHDTRKFCLEEVARLPDNVRELRVSTHYTVEVSPFLSYLSRELSFQYGKMQTEIPSIRPQLRQAQAEV
ncbi:MAG: nicotinate phosphoribosyltransferase [Candidatus Woesearchaeota archaeon]